MAHLIKAVRQRVAGSIHYVSLNYFLTVAMGSPQALTEMITRNISCGLKAAVA